MKIRLWLFQQGKIDSRNAQLILTYTTRVLDWTNAHSKTFSVGKKILKIGASQCPVSNAYYYRGKSRSASSINNCVYSFAYRFIVIYFI